MRLFFKIREWYQRVTDAISDWIYGDIYYYDVPTYPSTSKEPYVERRPKEKEYVDEPVKVEGVEGDDELSTLQMICVVCKECHEKDRAATGCQKPLEKHAVSSTRMKCDVCGKESEELVFCRDYIKAFGKKSFMFQETD